MGNLRVESVLCEFALVEVVLELLLPLALVLDAVAHVQGVQLGLLCLLDVVDILFVQDV